MRTGMRLALAHHPLCRHFDDDVLHRRVPVCSGCAMTWPVFLVVLLVAVPAVARGDLPAWPAIASGLVLGLPQFTTYRVRWPRPVRLAVKLLGGAGLGLAVAGGLLLPWPLWAKGVAALLVLSAFAGMQALRMRSVLATCRACPWRADWGSCPGFQEGGWRGPPPGHRPPRVAWTVRRAHRPPRAESGK